jgi:hypothetical protein
MIGFGTKGKCALTMHNAYYPSNQICVPSNVHLSLVTKASTSLILHKLRHAAKTCLLFTLPNVGVSHFTRLEMTSCGHVSDPYILFEFFM